MGPVPEFWTVADDAAELAIDALRSLWCNLQAYVDDPFRLSCVQNPALLHERVAQELEPFGALILFAGSHAARALACPPRPQWQLLILCRWWWCCGDVVSRVPASPGGAGVR